MIEITHSLSVLLSRLIYRYHYDAAFLVGMGITPTSSRLD